MNRQRLLQTALLASVGLNLFLVGTMVPRWFGPKPQRHEGMISRPGGPGLGGPLFMMRSMAGNLPEADAKILDEHFGADIEKFAGNMKAFRDRIDRLRDLMRADPFDPVALRAEMEGAMTERQSMEKAQIDAIIEVLGKLSSEGRRILAEIRSPHGMGDRDEMMRGPGMGPPPGGIPMDRERGPMAAPPPPPAPGN